MHGCAAVFYAFVSMFVLPCDYREDYEAKVLDLVGTLFAFVGYTVRVSKNISKETRDVGRV